MELTETKFKQTEIGMIPEDWEIKKIEDFAIVKTGGTPSTYQLEYWGGEIRWMNSGELNFKKVYEVKNRITELGLLNSATSLIPKNCILIGLAGQGKTRGTVAINKVELCVNQSIAAILPSKIIDYNYLYFNLDSRYNELRGLSTGDGGRGALNLFIIKNLIAPIPNIAEQTAIATALSDADAWINSLEKLIAKKRLVKQGAMQELLKPKEGWEVKSLGEVGEVLIGLTYKPADVADFGTLVLRSSNIQKNKLAFTNNVFVNMQIPDKIFVKENDLLICVRNGSKDLIGKCALIDKKTEGQAFGAFMSVFRSEINKYLFYVFQSNQIQIQIDENLGATINQLTNKVLKSFWIALPPQKERDRIASILSDMDAELEKLEEKLAKAKQVKQGMMQTLLTGRIRLV